MRHTGPQWLSKDHKANSGSSDSHTDTMDAWRSPDDPDGGDDSPRRRLRPVVSCAPKGIVLYLGADRSKAETCVAAAPHAIVAGDCGRWRRLQSVDGGAALLPVAAVALLKTLSSGLIDGEEVVPTWRTTFDDN
jgi:hypothetical protein